jgi:hypothetical protein
MLVSLIKPGEAAKKAVLGEEYDPRHATRSFEKNGKCKPTNNKFRNNANPDGQLCMSTSAHTFLFYSDFPIIMV